MATERDAEVVERVLISLSEATPERLAALARDVRRLSVHNHRIQEALGFRLADALLGEMPKESRAWGRRMPHSSPD